MKSIGGFLLNETATPPDIDMKHWYTVKRNTAEDVVCGFSLVECLHFAIQTLYCDM